MAEFLESPILFRCQGEMMLGIAHRARGEHSCRLGLLIVVGGPQYRVGSHRQFLHLARAAATAGFPVFRFDLRGMGDSTGSQITFEESGPDIHAAVEAFLAAEPNLEGIVLWGLCDAASSILMTGVDNPAVRGIVLLNPWVRSDATIASARISGYYGQRLMSRVFWKKFLSGKVKVWQSVASFLSDLVQRRRYRRQAGDAVWIERHGRLQNTDFRDEMLNGLVEFSSPVLLILSGSDLVAAEFDELTKNHDLWREALRKPNVTVKRLAGADHTFSSAGWRGVVEQWTIEWLESIGAQAVAPALPCAGDVSVSN